MITLDRKSKLSAFFDEYLASRLTKQRFYLNKNISESDFDQMLIELGYLDFEKYMEVKERIQVAWNMFYKRDFNAEEIKALLEKKKRQAKAWHIEYLKRDLDRGNISEEHALDEIKRGPRPFPYKRERQHILEKLRNYIYAHYISGEKPEAIMARYGITELELNRLIRSYLKFIENHKQRELEYPQRREHEMERLAKLKAEAGEREERNKQKEIEDRESILSFFEEFINRKITKKAFCEEKEISTAAFDNRMEKLELLNPEMHALIKKTLYANMAQAAAMISEFIKMTARRIQDGINGELKKYTLFDYHLKTSIPLSRLAIIAESFDLSWEAKILRDFDKSNLLNQQEATIDTLLNTKITINGNEATKEEKLTVIKLLCNNNVPLLAGNVSEALRLYLNDELSMTAEKIEDSIGVDETLYEGTKEVKQKIKTNPCSAQ